MVIRQGDIFWVDLGPPDYLRPAVVIQNDERNRSRIRTVLMCAITTNLSRGRDPGNTKLNPGESGLPEQSVVNVSQTFVYLKSDLRERIGKLDPDRIQEVVEGLVRFVQPTDL